MENLSSEAQAQFEQHLEAAARIMYAHTEPDQLKDFESIEWEVRSQLLQEVAPRIGEFFSQPGDAIEAGNSGR